MIEQSKNPLVSIIFTSYNHAEFLQKALDSLINQSYQNFELIIIDDFSTDGSREILLSYKDNEKIRLHFLDNNTGSYVKASNYGASFARGEYLLFAQCDDFAEPQQIETLLNGILKNNSVGVIFSRSNLIDKNDVVFADDYKGREKQFRIKCKHDTIISSSEMRRFLSYSCVLPNLSAALLKKELYTVVGGLPEEYQVAADWAFWLNLSERVDFFYISKPLNNFRQHETTIRNTIKAKKQIIEIYTIFYTHIKNYKLSKKSIRNMKLGAGFIWFSFSFLGFNAWLKCFFPVMKETRKVEKLNILYLFFGFLIFVKETLQYKFRL